jgi:hypothetical protein
MPLLSAITSISGSFPDIAVNPNKYSFGNKLFTSIGIFSRIINVNYDVKRVAEKLTQKEQLFKRFFSPTALRTPA